MNKNAVVDVDFLISLMKVKGLSESEFAHSIGVSHSMVNRVMNGKRGAGSKFVFGVLQTYPDVSYSQLIKSDKSLTKVNKQSRKTA